MRKAAFAAAGVLTLGLVAIPTGAFAAVDQPDIGTQGEIVMETGIDQMVADGWIAPDSSGGLYVDGDIVIAAATALSVHVGENDGYDRTAQFGPPWNEMIDGCDTRNRMLQRDFVSFTTDRDGDDCTVTTGVFDDPYSGEIIDFQHSNYPETGDGNSSAVQIDHMIPLKAAWNGGAENWTQEERVAFANDPANLWASKGSLNASKRDRLLGDWTPPNTDFYCEYAAKQTWLATTYDLTVTQDTKDAFIHAGETCAFPEEAGEDTPPSIGDQTSQMLNTETSLEIIVPVEGGPLTGIDFSAATLTPGEGASGSVRDSQWSAEVIDDNQIKVIFTLDADETWFGSASVSVAVTDAAGVISEPATVTVNIVAEDVTDPTDPTDPEPVTPAIATPETVTPQEIADGIDIPYTGFPANEDVTFTLTLSDGTPVAPTTVTADENGEGVLHVAYTTEDGELAPSGTTFTISAEGYDVSGTTLIEDATDPEEPVDPAVPAINAPDSVPSIDLAEGIEIPFTGFPANEDVTFTLTLSDGTVLSDVTVTTDDNGAGVLEVQSSMTDGSPVPAGTVFTITAVGYDVTDTFTATGADVPGGGDEPGTGDEKPQGNVGNTGDAGDTGNKDGELAYTGSDSAPMLIAGGVALAALIGGTILFLVRRRKAHTTAIAAEEPIE